MKKYYYLLGLLIFVVIGYFIVLDLYPKNAGRYPFLVFLFFSDIYVWGSIRKWIRKRRGSLRYLISIAYWIPLALLLLLVDYSLFFRDKQLNQALKIYSFGFIFIAYASKLLPFLFLLFADLIRGVQYLTLKLTSLKTDKNSLHQGKKITRSKFIRNMGLVSGGILFGGLLTGMFRWIYDFRIQQLQVRLPNLPAPFDGLRIVQVSDMHLGSWVSKYPLEEAVSRINNLNPDLVFFTGDLVNYKTDEAYPFGEVLSKIEARHGIFAILGNHDYGDYTRWPSASAKNKNMTDLYGFFEQIGWKLLRNENHILTKEGENIAIIGVENWGDFSRFPKYGDLQKALTGAEDSPVKLLLSHDPTHWDSIVTVDHPDVDITFSGHTHGFQFGIEIKNIKWSPAQYVYKRWAGLYEQVHETGKKQLLYVNRGLGTIGYPGRIGILPEITLFELTV